MIEAKESDLKEFISKFDPTSKSVSGPKRIRFEAELIEDMFHPGSNQNVPLIQEIGPGKIVRPSTARSASPESPRSPKGSPHNDTSFCTAAARVSTKFDHPTSEVTFLSPSRPATAGKKRSEVISVKVEKNVTREEFVQKYLEE